MSGQAARWARFAIASFEWMEVITLVILMGAPTASVIYSGAKVISVAFLDTSMLGLDLGNITVDSWIIGLSAALCLFFGGLKARAWADLIQGVALILRGVIVTTLFSD